MSQSYRLILIFVATMVCNGNSRPRELEVTNIYPVYRSIKQLELENRYEKPFELKQDDDLGAYLRIDIPHKHVDNFKTTENLKIKNNSKFVVDYVPVAVTIKKTNVKKWPNDQNGIESPDDLSLYNTYTNNINPLNFFQSSSGSSFPYVPHSKPSILILEELTSRPPYYEYSDSQPISVQRPEVAQYPFPINPAYPEGNPNTDYFGSQTSYHSTTTSQPFLEQYYHQQYQYQTEGHAPITFPTHTTLHETTQFSTEQTTMQLGYVTTTLKPETTTKKRKNTKCPNVSIMATSSINNNNSMNKEGCQDISIYIDTNLSNINTGFVKPTQAPTNTSLVEVQSDPQSSSGGTGILDIFWAMITRIFSFFLSNSLITTFLAPFSSLLAGSVSLSALVLPWFFPHLLWKKRKRDKNRFLILSNHRLKPTKYLYSSLDNNSFYLKRTKRNLESCNGKRRKKKNNFMKAQMHVAEHE